MYSKSNDTQSKGFAAIVQKLEEQIDCLREVRNKFDAQVSELKTNCKQGAGTELTEAHKTLITKQSEQIKL